MTGERFAFPVVCEDVAKTQVLECGVTKRELFAAMAMQAQMANPRGWDIKPENTAECAVAFADALITKLSMEEPR